MEVKLEKRSDGYFLVTETLTLRVTPDDKGISFIADKPVAAIEFNRPFGGFSVGVEGVYIEKISGVN